METIENTVDNKTVKFIKDTYQAFQYYADNASSDYKNARKFFAHDRHLNARELDLIILNYLYLYEFEGIKDKSLKEYVTSDPGLLQLMGIFERIRGMSGCKERFIDKLPAINNIYNLWRLSK